MTSADRHEIRYQRRKSNRLKKKLEYNCKYDDIEVAASTENLIHAHWDSKKGVMWKASPARYDKNYLRNASKLSKELLNGRYRCSGFFSFRIVERGKPREIHSLHYSERVVRRSVCINSLVPILSHNLIHDNGASLKDKGISFANKRCEKHLHSYFRKYKDNEGYVLVIDFKGYFGNIRHDKLIENLSNMISDDRLLELCKKFIRASAGDKEDEDKGLYIGPEDSQIFAVSYPNKIDHLIKDCWGIKYYARYNDDSYIIHRSKEELKEIKNKLFDVYTEYGIIPNPKKTQIIKLSKGFTFLKTKYYLTKNGKLVRKPCKDSIVRQRRKLKKFNEFMKLGQMNIKQIEQSYMSWRGYIEYKDSRRTVYNMDKLYFSLFGQKPWLNKRKRGN